MPESVPEVLFVIQIIALNPKLGLGFRGTWTLGVLCSCLNKDLVYAKPKFLSEASKSETPENHVDQKMENKKTVGI